MKRFILLLSIVCLSLGTYASSYTVTLVPDTGYEKYVPFSGATKVSSAMFDAIVKWLGEERISDASEYKLKRCMFFSCDDELERGKIFNITDEVVNVHATYHYYDGSVRNEDINVLPRTFSRLMGGKNVESIDCTFNY